MTLEEDAYFRGQAAGRVDARLDGHDRQLATINGSISRTGLALADLSRAVAEQTLEIQALRLQAQAKEQAEAASTQATEDAKKKQDNSWKPALRVSAILGGLATAAGFFYQIH